MNTLTNRELRTAIDVLHRIGEGCRGTGDFARAGVASLSRLVACEFITLSVCDLDTRHRTVVSNPRAVIGCREIEVFDHYFEEHPLVRAHGRNPKAVTYRIGDLVEDREFQRTPLYNEYYRPIRIDHVMAVPVHVDQRFLVSFVLNSSGRRGFSERDRAILDLIRPQMGNLYRLGVALDDVKAMPDHVNKVTRLAALSLTPRECEVMDWLAAGKTNRAIAAILGAKARTVEKHLERIYEKLGVETRTAAVLRFRSR